MGKKIIRSCVLAMFSSLGVMLSFCSSGGSDNEDTHGCVLVVGAPGLCDGHNVMNENDPPCETALPFPTSGGRQN